MKLEVENVEHLFCNFEVENFEHLRSITRINLLHRRRAHLYSKLAYAEKSGAGWVGGWMVDPV